MNVKELATSFSRAQKGVVILCSAMTALGGAALGAKLALQRFSDQINAEADKHLNEQIDLIKAHYGETRKKEEYLSPADAVAALHPEVVTGREILDGVVPGDIASALRSYRPESDAKPENLVEIAQNVYTDAAVIREPFDYEAELKRRDPSFPYLITEDEFNEAGPDYAQVQWTYYEGDGVLTNGRDEVIENIQAAVGDCAMRFGDGCEDENLVHVRNIQLELDIELARSRGKYSDEVLDIAPESELRHSDYNSYAQNRIKKFRLDRED